LKSLKENKFQMRHLKKLILSTLVLGVLSLSNAYSQTDTTKKIFHLLPKEHSPKFAGISSAIIPGAGQIYNKKYWKFPIVYSAGATAGFFIYYNYTIYKNFRDAYVFANDLDASNDIISFSVWTPIHKETYYPSLYDLGRMAEIQEIYRKYLDLSVISAVAVYGFNILDAVVDAHLFKFNVNDDLSFNLHPAFFNSPDGKACTSLTLQLKF